MKSIALVRGKYLNNFEGQNFIFSSKDKIELVAISSLFPLHKSFPFRVIKLLSIADLEELPLLGNISLFKNMIKFIANRVIGDSQYLFNLEQTVSQFDICVTADPHYYYSYQLAKLRKKGAIKKLVITSWETIPFNNETVETKKKIKYEVLRYADNFLCYTEKAKRALMSEGVNKNKITVIRLGVDLKRFINRTWNMKHRIKKSVTILFAGRLVKEKGIMDLYEVCKKIKKVKLKIIGEGPLRNDLLTHIRKDCLEDSISIETKSYEEMPEVYRKADIFVLPSRRTKTWEEQYGMVLIEAMATGLPVVAYDSGAIGEIIGNAGVLIPEGDTKSLFKSLVSLINDPAKRKKLGTMGRRRVERFFDAESESKSLKKYLLSLL